MGKERIDFKTWDVFLCCSSLLHDTYAIDDRLGTKIGEDLHKPFCTTDIDAVIGILAIENAERCIGRQVLPQRYSHLVPGLQEPEGLVAKHTITT